MATKTQQSDLRTTLTKLDSEQYQEIRAAYYKAVEGLAALASLLESADTDLGRQPGPLLEEHYIAIEAVNAMGRSELGRYL
jgi:hypothetical protein